MVLLFSFFKAFDTVEHKFLFKTIALFGFGNNFLNIVKMFYTDISSSVILITSTTKRFNINRGMRRFPLFYFCLWLNYYQSVLLIMMKSKVLNLLIMYLRYPNWQMTLLYF